MTWKCTLNVYLLQKEICHENVLDEHNVPRRSNTHNPLLGTQIELEYIVNTFLYCITMLQNEKQTKMEINHNMGFIQAWFVQMCPEEINATIMTSQVPGTYFKALVTPKLFQIHPKHITNIWCHLALSFEMKKKVFRTLSRGDKSRYCVSMNKSYMLQILKKMTWLIPTILFTINMQSLTIHLWQTNTFILPNPLHNILKISSGHGISNNVVQKFGQRCNKVANHIFQTQCIAEG